MPELVADCPRCGVGRITFDLAGENWIGERYEWQQFYEAFCICRGCHRGTTFKLAQEGNASQVNVRQSGLGKMQGALNDVFSVEGYINLKDRQVATPPEHLPEDVDAAFREGAVCMSVSCNNAGGTMFRLCLDFATKSLMPEQDVEGLNAKIRRSLGLRLEWLFGTKRLPEALRDLAACVKDDGNDGAHEGTLTKVDAEDLQEFAYVLLERLYTEPKRLEIAMARRQARHNQGNS
ncbi:DUF4145 domain-containing protein [Paraburkholderia sediminicola]|uniref:DUF4145 domain-containing protein n=1 Tax=Paraburkholderia sediminicola TaxID=458836 RepID=UPI0038B8F87C